MNQFGKPLSSAVTTPARTSLLTYEPYFGLREKPFSLSADPRFLYKSSSHESTFEDLRAGIQRREGLIVLTGDIGTGKTTLCRAVLESLDRKTFSTFVPDPFLSREDLLKMLLVEFGVVSIDELKSGRLAGATRPDLSYPLYEFLKTLVPLQAFAVLVIDEAQNLPVSLLEEIRILSDLEAPEKLLQVVLVGQSELHEKLKLHEMRQVDQRVSVRCDLQPLGHDAVAAYIAHRLDIAGGGRGRVAFTDGAADEVYRYSKGVPRVVNLVCDRALHHGFLERSPRIYPPHVVRAATDLCLRKATETGKVTPAAAIPTMPPPAAHVQRPPAPVEQPTIPAALLEPLIAPARAERSDHAADFELKHAVESAPVPVVMPVNDGLLAFPVEPEEEPESVVDALVGRFSFQSPSRPMVMVAAVALMVTTFVGAAMYLRTGRTAADQDLGLAPLPPAPKSAFRQAPDFLPMHIAASIAIGEPANIYTIDVALFSGPQRAVELTSQLSAAGFNARIDPRDLPTGHIYIVRIGPFITQADADTALAKIRALPGYADARITTLLPPAPQ